LDFWAGNESGGQVGAPRAKGGIFITNNAFRAGRGTKREKGDTRGRKTWWGKKTHEGKTKGRRGKKIEKKGTLR